MKKRLKNATTQTCLPWVSALLCGHIFSTHPLQQASKREPDMAALLWAFWSRNEDVSPFSAGGATPFFTGYAGEHTGDHFGRRQQSGGAYLLKRVAKKTYSAATSKLFSNDLTIQFTQTSPCRDQAPPAQQPKGDVSRYTRVYHPPLPSHYRTSQHCRAYEHHRWAVERGH